MIHRFKPGDVVIYTCGNYQYMIELIEEDYREEIHWVAKFLKNLSLDFGYKHGDLIRLPEKNLRKLTKLERALK